MRYLLVKRILDILYKKFKFILYNVFINFFNEIVIFFKIQFLDKSEYDYLICKEIVSFFLYQKNQLFDFGK